MKKENKMHRYNSVIFIVMIMFMYSSFAIELDFAPPRDPNIPWPNDPDITALSDDKLIQLWDDTVLEFRRQYPNYAGFVRTMGMDKEYTSVPKSREDQEYLINYLAKVLNSQPVDWNCVRVILILMYAGMDADNRIPELANQLFQMQRPMKMSDNQGWAYREMLEVLRLQKSAESAQVLAAGADREYWGNDPFHTTAIIRDDTEMSIINMRLFCIDTLERMPFEIAVPFLQQIAKKYSDKDLSTEHRTLVSYIKRICSKFKDYE